MSDYCKSCHYDYKRKVGEKACPFNSLYWDFLERHREKFEKNFRMAFMYRTWDKKDGDTKAQILERADWVKQHANEL